MTLFPHRPRLIMRWSRSAARPARAAALLLVLALLSLALCSAAAQPAGAVGTEADLEAGPEADLDAAVAVAWYALQLELLRETPGFSPPVAARALGYSGVALWETLVPAVPGGLSLAGQVNGLGPLPEPDGDYHAPAAANHALAAVVRGLYPNAFAAHLADLDALERAWSARFALEVDPATLRRSERFGAAVAEAVLLWSFEDGGSEGYLGGFFGFTPEDMADTPGAWTPTPRRNGPPFPPLHPQWGENRPFVLASGDTCRAPPPPAYSEAVGSAFYEEAREVYDAVRALTPAQTDIARHWADDPGQTSTLAGHWIAILNGVLLEQEAPLALAAEAYARLGVALSDAMIACWNTKYHYNLLRPITYIQRVIDPAWNTPDVTDPVLTPPFPEYTSGHSVLSSAAAAVLSDLFGSVAFTDRTHARRGYAPRDYGSFEEAALEAGLSRLLGGIHFRSAVAAGREQGQCVAERVLALRFR